MPNITVTNTSGSKTATIRVSNWLYARCLSQINTLRKQHGLGSIKRIANGVACSDTMDPVATSLLPLKASVTYTTIVIRNGMVHKIGRDMVRFLEMIDTPQWKSVDL